MEYMAFLQDRCISQLKLKLQKYSTGNVAIQGIRDKVRELQA
jgi:hypothetical protein